jgi:long-chain acyl-CoA synthetase
MIVGGDDKKFVSALIVPAFAQVAAWAKENGIPGETPAELLRHPKVNQLIHADIKKFNHDFGSWEQVKKFVLLEQEWSVESGELTPTMKPKRKVIAEKYRPEIDQMYAGADDGHHPE